MTLSKRPAEGWNIQRITTHPGEMLREEFLLPMDVTPNQLATQTHIAATRVHEILHERRGITADTALRFARFFGNSPEFWLNLQAAYDLSRARIKLQATLERDVRPLAHHTAG